MPKTSANWTVGKMQDVECRMWIVDAMQYAQFVLEEEEWRVSVNEEKKREKIGRGKRRKLR